MTCEHIITNEIIENNKRIEIYYDNQKKRIKIELNKNERFIRNFLDLNIDCTIVEILPNDNISEDYFLIPNIDYSINYDNLIKKNIYIPRFNSSYSKGEINNREKYKFSYNVGNCSSGSPIFLMQTTSVIGIHKGGDKEQKENYGDFIFPIINLLKNEKIGEENYNNKFKKKNIICKTKINKKTEINPQNQINKKNEIKIIIKPTTIGFYLLDYTFTNKNNDKCEVIINEQNGFELNKLGELYHCDEPKIGEEQKFEIILKEIKKITDMSFMFHPIYCQIIQIDFSK